MLNAFTQNELIYKLKIKSCRWTSNLKKKEKKNLILSLQPLNKATHP